jgi:hypothetical protein
LRLYIPPIRGRQRPEASHETALNFYRVHEEAATIISLMQSRAETYTTTEAAKILRRSSRRILQMLEARELEGDKDSAGRWRIPQRAVYDLLPRRPLRERTSRQRREALEPTENASELRLRVEALQRELGRLEGRLELTSVAESTLRESLERERDRADAERKRADAIQLEANRLRMWLEEARLSWWRRFFGFR